MHPDYAWENRRPRKIWAQMEDNIKFFLNKKGDGVDSIRLAQDRNIGFGKNREFPLVPEQISASQGDFSVGQWAFLSLLPLGGGEWLASRRGRFTSGEIASGTHWIGG
jgi:hypothetical protein